MTPSRPTAKMEYRHLGRCGLRVSALSFGSWATFGAQLDVGMARDCLAAAWEAGVNFFDNAESYADGESERIMGSAIADLRWPRHSYVVSTKLFVGIHDAVNMRSTLNRKYLLQAVDGSLERLGMDFVDLLFCHRPDPSTPVEETVWAMSDIIASGRALYWGTSEWSATRILEACEVAERHHLRKPVVEQPQYNLLTRDRVEGEYARLYGDVGLGITTWSPLAFGLLTGKYLEGEPDGARAGLPGLDYVRDRVTDPEANAKVRRLKVIANELGITIAQLSIAWCLVNPHVSTVITGASRVEQVVDNMQALAVVPLLTDEVLQAVEQAVAGA